MNCIVHMNHNSDLSTNVTIVISVVAFSSLPNFQKIQTFNSIIVFKERLLNLKFQKGLYDHTTRKAPVLV